MNTHPQPVPGPGSEALKMLPRLRRDPINFFTEMSRKYGGIVRIPVPGYAIHLITKPDPIQHVLLTHQRNYLKGESVDAIRPLIGNGLASSDGDFWKKQRRLMQPAFRRKRLEQLSGIMIATGQEFMERWAAHAEKGKPLELTDEMMHLTLQVIVKTMFSTDIGDQLETLSSAFETTLDVVNRQSWGYTLPGWLPTPDNIRRWFALRTLNKTVFGLIEKRRASEEERHDLLDMLLAAQDPESGAGMTDQQLRDEVMTIFFAGHETTALTLTWAWTLLAEHPQVLSRLQTEVDRVLGERTPGVEDLDSLVYTRMIIDETLRLYPPAWVFVRSAAGEDVIEGYHIPENAFLMLSPYITHHDPDLWENPKKFDPERFGPDRAKDIPKMAYYPFGGGPRMCIGKNFALMEAQLILAMMAQRFTVELLPDQIVEPHYYVTLRPKEDVMVQFSRRER